MMANDIGAYFAGYSDQEEAVEGVANHLRNFWEARMRREIVDYVGKGRRRAEPARARSRCLYCDRVDR